MTLDTPPTGKLQDNDRRAKFVITLISLFLITFLFFITFCFALGRGPLSGVNFQILMILSPLISVLSIFSCGSFILWFNRSYQNLSSVCEIPSLQSPDWHTRFSWFVPIVNLYIPFRTMIILYTELANLLHREGIEKELPTMWVKVWWGLWLSLWFTRWFSKFFIPPSSDAKGILSLLFGLVTIKVINDYNNAEKLLFSVDTTVKSLPTSSGAIDKRIF